MTESAIIQALVNLGGTGIMVYILWRLLERVLDLLIGVLKENAAAMQANAIALTRVEKAIDALPSFMAEVLSRLSQGETESANHERRIEGLEPDGVAG